MASHTGFIAAAFGITALVVAAMIGTIVADYRVLRRQLSTFPDRSTRDDP